MDTHQVPQRASQPQGDLEGGGFIVLNRFRSTFNGRNGISWDGGGNLTATYCDVWYTGMGRLLTKPGDGLDIEWENGNSIVAQGLFTNCRFMYNSFNDVQCDTKAGTANYTYDFNFKMSTFVGSELGNALWPDGQNFKFENSAIYGASIHAYNALGHSNNVNTKFIDCNFNEDYASFSHNQDNCDECGTGLTCTSHPWLIDFFFAPRTSFLRSSIETNKQTRLIFIQGGVGAERVSIIATNFINHGINDNSAIQYTLGTANNAFRILGSFKATDIHQLIYNLYSLPSPLISASSCLSKYTDIPYDNRVGLLGNCIAPWYNLETAYCPDTPYCALCTERNSILNTQPTGWLIFPNPTSDHFKIQNLPIGSTVSLRNVLGECVSTKIIDSENSEIDISKLPVGLYFVLVNGITQSKLIKLE